MRRRRFLQGALLASAGALAMRLESAALAASGSCRRLLVYFNKGGWDPSFVFDPHFESPSVDSPPDSTLAETGGISFADSGSRPSVRSFFESHAPLCTVVNGIAVGSISHAKCERLLLTGSRAPSAPDLPSLLASELGTGQALPFAAVAGPRFPGRLGAVMTPMNALLSSILSGGSPDTSVRPDEELVREYLAAEASGLPGSDPLLAQYLEGLERRALLEEQASSLSIPSSPSFTESAVLAMDLLSMGLSTCAVIQGDLPERCQWDSHQDNDGNQGQAFEHLFSRLGWLVGELQDRQGPGGEPLLADTLLLVVSEMGRTPLRNGSMGKDHWPYTSAMLVGGGHGGGRVIGSSDGSMVGEPIDMQSGEAHSGGKVLTAAGFLSGICALYGVDSAEWFPGVSPLSV